MTSFLFTSLFIIPLGHREEGKSMCVPSPPSQTLTPRTITLLNQTPRETHKDHLIQTPHLRVEETETQKSQ